MSKLRAARISYPVCTGTPPLYWYGTPILVRLPFTGTLTPVLVRYPLLVRRTRTGTPHRTDTPLPVPVRCGVPVRGEAVLVRRRTGTPHPRTGTPPPYWYAHGRTGTPPRISKAMRTCTPIPYWYGAAYQ